MARLSSEPSKRPWPKPCLSSANCCTRSLPRFSRTSHLPTPLAKARKPSVAAVTRCSGLSRPSDEGRLPQELQPGSEEDFRGGVQCSRATRFDRQEQLRMPAKYTAVIQRDGKWWLGWIEEIPGVNAQERTRRQLLASLRSALEEALEMTRAEARSAANDAYEEVTIQV